MWHNAVPQVAIMDSWDVCFLVPRLLVIHQSQGAKVGLVTYKGLGLVAGRPHPLPLRLPGSGIWGFTVFLDEEEWVALVGPSAGGRGGLPVRWMEGANHLLLLCWILSTSPG